MRMLESHQLAGAELHAIMGCPEPFVADVAEQAAYWRVSIAAGVKKKLTPAQAP